MVSINKVILAGNLTKDPELRYTNSGIPVATLDIAINERVKKNDEWVDETLFINRITVWRKQAENAAEYLKKGRAVLVEGRLKRNEWETDSGEKRVNLEVVATNVHYLTPKSGTRSNPQEDMEPMKDDNIPF